MEEEPGMERVRARLSAPTDQASAGRFAYKTTRVFLILIAHHTWYYIHGRGLRRGVLTPTSGSAHARNGRRCRKIEAVRCDSTAKRCTKKVQIVEQKNNKGTLRCALHPTQRFR